MSQQPISLFIATPTNIKISWCLSFVCRTGSAVTLDTIILHSVYGSFDHKQHTHTHARVTVWRTSEVRAEHRGSLVPPRGRSSAVAGIIIMMGVTGEESHFCVKSLLLI